MEQIRNRLNENGEAGGTLPTRPAQTDHFTTEAGIGCEWQIRYETLHFQVGPIKLGEVSLKALTRVGNPFVAHAERAIPFEKAFSEGCRAVVVPAKPTGGSFATVRFGGGVVRYAARYGDRYVVDLEGSFAEYLKKFSKKSRGNLHRMVKKFASERTGVPIIREYRNAREIREFRDIAISISKQSYKNDLGWGFQESEEFALQLEIDAATGRVRGYILRCGDEDAAYVFCRIDHDVIVYKHIGYHPKFAQKSPGTALLYLILQRLFDEGQIRLLDFDGTEYYPYKEFFATRAIRCARVFWFRPRLPELALFTSHWVLTTMWRLSSALRASLRRGQHRWVSCRIQQKRSSPPR